MQRARMQGKLPPEVDVTAHPQQPKHHLGTEDQPVGWSRLETLRLDRRAALDLVAGEVSHELAHTLTFLRCLAEEPGSPESHALSSEDGQLARRQIERLQRMLRHLRKLTLPPPERESVPGVDTLRRAAAAAAELLTTKRLTWAWAVPAPLMLRSDAPLFYLLARDLLVAVARGADQEGTITVQATLPSGRDGGTLEVWRTASGEAPSPATDSFDPWTAMLSDSADLGLAVCHRIARTLGWELAVIANEGRAGFRLLIPAASFCLESAR
jgi:signal transduction histidine kinase